MPEKNDTVKGTEPLMEKIESQLDEIFSKKKADIEKELEERIKQTQEDAQKKIKQAEQAFEEEKSILGSYSQLFAELESNKKVYKTQIKNHLSKAVEFQNQIANMTGNTLDELKTVGDLNQKLEQFQRDAEEKLIEVRKNLTEKYGIETPEPEGNHKEEEINFNLDKELNKLTKIKELLGSSSKESQDESAEPESQIESDGGNTALQTVAPEISVETEEPAQPESDTPEQVEEEQAEPESDTPEQVVEEQTEPESDTPKPVEEEQPEEVEISEPDSDKPEESEPSPDIERFPKPDFSPEAPAVEPSEIEKEEEKPEAEPQVEESPEKEPTPEYFEMEENQAKPEISFQQVFDELEKYRKGACEEDNGEVSYFQKDKKTILDGECLISALNNSIESATELYEKLEKTESPKEQFFIKQDIIRHQEILRKLMLTSIKMCDQESCELPKYTIEILNVDVLKNILEKVSMENWSDKEDFKSFDEFAKGLKDAYYGRITPPALYLQSILDELGK